MVAALCRMSKEGLQTSAATRQAPGMPFAEKRCSIFGEYVFCPTDKQCLLGVEDQERDLKHAWIIAVMCTKWALLICLEECEWVNVYIHAK
jgi:hypothetical protein